VVVVDAQCCSILEGPRVLRENEWLEVWCHVYGPPISTVEVVDLVTYMRRVCVGTTIYNLYDGGPARLQRVFLVYTESRSLGHPDGAGVKDNVGHLST